MQAPSLVLVQATDVQACWHHLLPLLLLQRQQHLCRVHPHCCCPHILQRAGLLQAPEDLLLWLQH